ncbi:MAG: type II toxin-antitoxin system PemK/MazF family toxin [Planctomycetota bacterium]|nr:type II toxin-antitoxin system PemK/MazF family toxin [Planctomycetota bacterium]
METPERGEVWIADLGWAAKTRPVLVLNVPFSNTDYALFATIPHTTSPRGSKFEAAIPIRGLKDGAFNVQGLLAVPSAKFFRKITSLTPEQLQDIEAGVIKWLGIGA